MKVAQSGEGEPVVILNHNKPAFYIVPVESYESTMHIPQWHRELLKELEAREHKTKSLSTVKDTLSKL